MRANRLKRCVAVLVSVLASLTVAAGASLARSKSSSGQAVKADDPGCRICVSQAASLFAARRVSEAANLLKSWQSRCPHNAQLHLMLSTVLLRLGGHTEEALHAAEQAVAVAPDSVPAHLQLGLLLSATENNTRAADELRKTVELDPGNYEAWSTLATTYSKLHEDSKAQECTNKAADLEPSTKTVRLRMLHNLEHAGKVAEAKAEVKRLVNNSEFSPEFLEQLAGEALNIGDWEDALAAGNKVAEAYPKAITPLKLIALAQFYGRNYQDCLNSARRMQELDRQSAEARALKGRALSKLGSMEEAEKEVQESLSRRPQLPLGLLAQGEIDFSRGKYAEAAEHVSSSIEGDPAFGETPEICFLLAQALDKQGERQSALAYYRKSLARGLSGDDANHAREAIARLGPESSGK